MNTDTPPIKDSSGKKRQETYSLKKELKNFEKNFEKTHHRRPSLEDILKWPIIGKRPIATIRSRLYLNVIS
jgi:hypothetical protein